MPGIDRLPALQVPHYGPQRPLLRDPWFVVPLAIAIAACIAMVCLVVASL